MVRLESLEPVGCADTCELRGRQFRELQEVGCMAPLKFRELGRRAGLLDGVLPDCFEHPEARRASISLVAIDQALRQQGVETVEDPDAQVLVSRRPPQPLRA